MRVVVTGASGTIGTGVLEALETLQGLRDGAGDPTPPLEPHAGGPLRVEEPAGSAGAHGPLDP